jgi:hypothetical protein
MCCQPSRGSCKKASRWPLNHQKTTPSVQNWVVASHEPPTSISIWLGGQDRRARVACKLRSKEYMGPKTARIRRLQNSSAYRANHQDFDKKTRILGGSGNRTTTICPNRVRTAAEADPMCRATSRYVWHSPARRTVSPA